MGGCWVGGWIKEERDEGVRRKEAEEAGGGREG